MGILESLEKHKSRERKKYEKRYGELAQKQLEKGFGLNTLPSVLDSTMDTIIRWIETSSHFRRCVEIGLSGQEYTLEKIGLQMAVKNTGNFKAWELLCKQKLGWDTENKNESKGVDINISVE